MMQDEIGDINLQGIFSGGGGGADALTYQPGALFGGGAPPVIQTGTSLLPDVPTQPEPGGVEGFLKGAGKFLSGGKEQSGLDTLLGLTRAGLGVAQIPLSISALNQAAGARRALESSVNLARQSSERAATAAAPAVAASGALIPAGTSALLGGSLPPEIEANINEQINQYRSTKLDQLVRQGMDPIQARAQIEGEVQQLEQRLRLQWAESLTGAGGGLLSQATGAIVAETGGAGTAGRLAGAEFQTVEEILQNANNALARLLG